MVGTEVMPSLTADEAGQLKMMQVVLVGLGAGAAAALLLASVVSGSIAAIFLFYLAPLPILIAALGWSHIAGLIAAALCLRDRQRTGARGRSIGIRPVGSCFGPPSSVL
jgi:hypothetical protein